MGEVYDPYAPLNVLKPVATNLWIADGPEIRFRYFGIALPFPTRMSVIRLDDGSLWVHSPIAPKEALFAALEQLGPVRFLIAPNSLHYWWVPDWQRQYPEATTYGVAGLTQSARRPLQIDEVLQNEPPAAWAGEIDQVVAPGSLLTEEDFFHRASRTLILTDLIENFEPKRVRSTFYRFLMQAFGCADPDGKAPYDMQLSFWRHRRALRAAVQQMIAWAPERIIITHGRWYAANGVAELKRAFRWVL